MIALKLTFPSGRFHATPWGRHVNEGVPEWPPSPWRLMRALLSAWKTQLPGVSEPAARQIFSALSAEAPLFSLPQATVGHTRSYMPWLKNNKDSKVMIFDTFVALPRDEPLYIFWPDTELEDELKKLLEKMAGAVGYLGRAESWCLMERVDQPPEPNCFPLHSKAIEALPGYEDARLLLPAKDQASELLTNLAVDTAELRGREKRTEPPGSCWVTYAIRKGALEQPRLQHKPAVSAERKAVTAVYALDRYVLPPIEDALLVGERARAGLMGCYGRLYSGETTTVLSGRGPDGPLKGHLHAFYLPLDTDGDARIDHLLIHAPSGFNSNEEKALGALRQIPWGEMGSGAHKEENRRLKVILLGLFDDNPPPGAVPQTGPALRWRSAVPYVLTRHPKCYRDGRPKLNDYGEQKDGPEDQVRREWALRRKQDSSLPEISAIITLPVLEPGTAKSIRWLNFKRKKTRGHGTSANIARGLEITFAAPLKGPLALGYGCHQGLGQFKPIAQG